MTTEHYIDASCISRLPIVIARMQVQGCAHPQYGQGGCAATNPEQCDYTIETCKSKCDFLCENVDYIHTDCKTGQVGNSYDPDIKGFPDYGLGSVEFCKGMPQSGTVSVQLRDSPSCDYADRHLDERPSGPDLDGYRLARFDAKNNLEGRLFEIGLGYCDHHYPSTFFNSRYYIESFTGPSGNDGCWTLKAKDALSLLGDDRAQYPSLDSVALLVNDLQVNTGLLELSHNNGDSAGDVSYVCVGTEVYKVEYVAVVNGSLSENHFYKVLDREVCGSKRNESLIERGTEATFAVHWSEGTNVADVYLDLFIKGAGLPISDQECNCGPYSSCVVDVESFADFAEGCGKMFTIPETIICEPTGLRTLADELAVFGVIPYLDDCDQKIKLHHYRPTWCNPLQDLPVFHERDLIECRINVTPKDNERYTSVDVRGAPLDCTKGITDENLKLVGRAQGIAGTGEVCGNPNWLPPKNRSIKSRFIGGSNEYMGPRLAQRIWYARRKKVRQIRFRVHASRLPVGLRKTSFFMVRHKQLDVKRVPAAIYWLTRMRPLRDSCWEITAMTSGFDASQRWRSEIKTCEGECAATISAPSECPADSDVGCALVY